MSSAGKHREEIKVDKTSNRIFSSEESRAQDKILVHGWRTTLGILGIRLCHILRCTQGDYSLTQPILFWSSHSNCGRILGELRTLNFLRVSLRFLVVSDP